MSSKIAFSKCQKTGQIKINLPAFMKNQLDLPNRGRMKLEFFNDGQQKHLKLTLIGA